MEKEEWLIFKGMSMQDTLWMINLMEKELGLMLMAINMLDNEI